MPTKFEDLFAKLKEDRDLRRRFAEDPPAALDEMGFDPELLAIPDDVSADEMLEKLDSFLDGDAEPEDLSEEEALSLSPNDLWRRMGRIGLTADVRDSVVVATSAAVAPVTVIYGPSIVMSTVTTAGASGGIRSLDQIKLLRDLQRADPDRLSFSVSGPDGIAVDGIGLETIKAFLGRLR